MRRCMSRWPPFLKSKTINLPRLQIADIFLPLIRLQNELAEGSAIVRSQKTFASVITVPSIPASFRSPTIVCTSGSSGILIQVAWFKVQGSKVARFSVQRLQLRTQNGGPGTFVISIDNKGLWTYKMGHLCAPYTITPL